MGPGGGNTPRFMSQLTSIDFRPYISQTLEETEMLMNLLFGFDYKLKVVVEKCKNAKLSNSCGVGHPHMLSRVHDKSQMLKSAQHCPRLNSNVSPNLRLNSNVNFCKGGGGLWRTGELPSNICHTQMFECSSATINVIFNVMTKRYGVNWFHTFIQTLALYVN